MTTNPNDPAHPCIDENDHSKDGLTKLELLAGMAMQGMWANARIVAVFQEQQACRTLHAAIANDAVKSAKALIAALNEAESAALTKQP